MRKEDKQSLIPVPIPEVHEIEKKRSIDLIHPTMTVEEYGQLDYLTPKIVDIGEFITFTGSNEAAIEHLLTMISSLNEAYNGHGLLGIVHDDNYHLTLPQRIKLVGAGVISFSYPVGYQGDRTISGVIKDIEEKFAQEERGNLTLAEFAAQQELKWQRWLSEQNETEMNEQAEYHPH